MTNKKSFKGYFSKNCRLDSWLFMEFEEFERKKEKHLDSIQIPRQLGRKKLIKKKAK